MKILIIRFSSLGDVILTTSVPAFLKAKYPGCQVHFATKIQFSDILQGNPDIDCIFTLEKNSESNFLKQIQKEQPYDLIIDLHASLRSRMICFKIEHKKLRRFKKPYLKRFLLVICKINLLKNHPDVATRYLMAAGASRAEAESLTLKKPRIFTDDDDTSIFEQTAPKPVLALAPGSQWFTKKWPSASFAKLLELLEFNYPKQFHYILLGSKNEEADAQDILNRLPDSFAARIHNLTGQTSLRQTANILSQTQIFVCNDSGLMHLAAAFDTYILAIFAATVPELGFLPPTKNFSLLQNRVPCAPCSPKGRPSCPKKHFRCALELKPQAVFQAVQKVISQSHFSGG